MTISSPRANFHGAAPAGSPRRAHPPRSAASPRASRRTGLQLAVAAAAALGGLALGNTVLARRAERRHPPLGRVARLGGVRLHWIDTDPGRRQTDGPPVVLLHGNLVTLDDWIASGVVDRLAAAGRRVVAFDRPGFGHSERPAGRWGAGEQAALLRRATRELGVERPVVVGHSWGALVALAWALDAPVAGTALVSGYYFPSARLDALLVAPAAAPGLGPLVRRTVAPPFARLTLPSTLKAMFAPRPVPAAFRALFPQELVPRPSQIRATASDGAIMVDEARRLRRRLRGLVVPRLAMAGLDDRIADPHDQTARLAHETGARLLLVPEAGHMVHHAAPGSLADAILALGPPQAVNAERRAT